MTTMCEDCQFNENCNGDFCWQQEWEGLIDLSDEKLAAYRQEVIRMVTEDMPPLDRRLNDNLVKLCAAEQWRRDR